MTPLTVVARTVQLRQHYGWSMHKLQALLVKVGYAVSVNTVGRILKRHRMISW